MRASSLDILAEELGLVAGRIERESALRIDAALADVRRIDAERELRLANLERAVADRLTTVKDGAPGLNGTDGVDGKDGAPGQNGTDGVDGKDGAAGPNGTAGADGKDGAPGQNGKAGVDADTTELNALRSMVEALQARLADTDSAMNDREFQQRIDACLAHPPVPAHDVNGDHGVLAMVRDAVAGAMQDAPRPTINVSVANHIPKRGKEVMTVEHDAKGRIKRSVKQEVD